jgi:hypothetical protein
MLNYSTYPAFTLEVIKSTLCPIGFLSPEKIDVGPPMTKGLFQAFLLGKKERYIPATADFRIT